MAAVKKYAGLPDLDLDQEEIYETPVPDLTEASTLPTESTDASDDENPDFDKSGLNPDAARARFAPAIVDARNVNFSDTIDRSRKDYQTRRRRRRLRRAALVQGQTEEYDSDDAEHETLQGRLARLRREAAELQAEIEHMEKKEDHEDDDGSDYEDTVDHQAHAQDQKDLSQGVEALGKALEKMSWATRKTHASTMEDEFLQSLQRDPRLAHSTDRPTGQDEQLPQSTISAIAAFSDRLTALETILGMSSQASSSPVTTPLSFLPTLDILNTQIGTLHSTLSPRPDHPVTGSRNVAANTSTGHLDPLAAKIRHLISESKRLEESRRAAAKSFEELLETRDRHAHLFSPSHSSALGGTEPRLSRNLSPHDANGRPGSTTQDGGMTRKDDMQQQFTSLFLDDQASKITALYNLLPTIQNLQPLLPVVLERLRALSVIHAGAADVKGELDEVERRLMTQEQDVKKWRDAVEHAETSMKEGKEVMKENVEVIGEAVRHLERRLTALAK